MNSLAEVRRVLDRIDQAGADKKWTLEGTFTLAQALAHCAQSVEYSITGYPAQRKWATHLFGPIAVRVILARGRLGHDISAPVPDAPELSRDLSLSDASRRLRSALDRFESHSEALAPHFVFGRLSKEQYARFHALHAADHLASLAG